MSTPSGEAAGEYGEPFQKFLSAQGLVRIFIEEVDDALIHGIFLWL